jgi:hypothetical protein
MHLHRAIGARLVGYPDGVRGFDDPLVDSGSQIGGVIRPRFRSASSELSPGGRSERVLLRGPEVLSQDSARMCGRVASVP